MEENIIQRGNSTIIINGGNPLPGCPQTWEEAYALEEKMNEGKQEDEPRWDFDCGFKLDFDGGIVRISSRFYPPKTHYGSTWDGTCSVYVLDKEVCEKKFNFPTLDELQRSVEAYVKTIVDKLSSTIAQ